MSEGDSNPVRDSAAKAASRASAVSAALADGMSNEDTAGYEVSDPVTTGYEAEEVAPAPDAVQKVQEVVSDDGASQGQQDQALSQESQLQAPSNWPKDRQDEFNALPDNAKRILLARDKEFSNGIRLKSEEFADHRKRSEALVDVLKPYEADLQSANMDHVSAVRWMVQERETFNRDPAGFLLGYMEKQNADPAMFIQHLAERAGVKLTQDQPGQQPPQTEQGQEQEWWLDDPGYKVLKSHNDTLQGEVQSLKQQLSQFANQYSQREAMSLQDEITAFQTSTDANGNPAYPHYDQVREKMQWLMMHDQEVANIPDYKAQAKLKAAYEKAIWLHPDIRTSFIDSQVNQKLTAQMGQQSLDRAKAAATKKGSPGANGTAQPGKMSRQEAVRAALMETGQA